MNYELAKELKDAGFPQEAKYGTYFFNNNKVLVFIDENIEGLSWTQYVRCPTLSELIEACKGITIKLWINANHNQCGVQRELQSLDDVTWYDTPEEAVARLYLALHLTKGN